MSTENALVTITEVPAYLAKYASSVGALASISDAALAGLSAGMPPTIALNGTRFVVKEGGEDKTLNQLELQCVVLKAKAGIDKQWYSVKFVPGQEPSSPDCYSLDGIKPEPDSPNIQCANCAGCAQNQFGSATDNAGNAMKGKACSDTKVVAIWANSGTYRFRIPAASLKNFVAYVKQLQSHNLYLPAVITTIGFDPTATYPLLTFKAQGALAEAQFNTIMSKIEAPEVDEALMVKRAQQQIAAPTPPPVSTVNVAEDLGFSTAPVDTTPAQPTAAQKAAATKKANMEKAAAEAAAAALAAASRPAAAVVEDAILSDPLAGIGAVAGPSAEELSDALGL